MWATCGISVDKGVDSLWITCGRDVDGFRVVADGRSVGTVGNLPTPWGNFLVYKQFSRLCEAHVRGFAASPAYARFGYSKDDFGASTLRGRPEVVER